MSLPLVIVGTNAALPVAMRAQSRAVGSDGTSQADTTLARSLQAPRPVLQPFGVGERMDYDVRYFGGKKGTGSMEVREIVDVRGQPAWHSVFKVAGRVAFLISVDITLESWFEVTTMNSLRFHQDQRYTGTKKIQTIEIFPERGMYKEDALPERVSVRDPLDDGSFLYFVRSIPLEVGKEYAFARYYKPEKNPVRIKVVRRETVKTPAGEFATLVLRPEINSGGLFAKGKSEVWVTDDARRIVVKLVSDLPGANLSLWLTRYTPATTPAP